MKKFINLLIENGFGKMTIGSIIKKKQNGEYERFHVEHEDAKSFVTSTEGFWEQTELPIIGVEKRKISSKRVSSMMSYKNEKEVEIACLIYAENFDKSIVDKTLTVKEIVDRLLAFNNPDLEICAYSDLPDDLEREWWYLDVINMYPSDDYDCRCDNINEFFEGYHTEAFLA